MHDPFLKSVFSDRRMVEILIRDQRDVSVERLPGGSEAATGENDG